jgi:hypothetical protein
MLIEKKKCQNRKKKPKKSASFLYSSNYCCVVHQIKNYQTKKIYQNTFFYWTEISTFLKFSIFLIFLTRFKAKIHMVLDTTEIRKHKIFEIILLKNAQ